MNHEDKRDWWKMDGNFLWSSERSWMGSHTRQMKTDVIAPKPNFYRVLARVNIIEKHY